MNWDNVYEDLKSVAGRAADKLGQTASIATLQVKLSMAENKLVDAYAALGKVAYEHFTDDKDLSALIAKEVSNVNDAHAVVLGYRAQIADLQAKGNAKKEAKTEDV